MAKRQQKQENERMRLIKQARREWMGRWVEFDPEDGTGLQIGVVSLVNARGEIYVSYGFDERGCYILPVCTIEEVSQALKVVENR